MARLTTTAAFLALTIATVGGPAVAGFLPPSVWQTSGQASETVLAIRAVVGDTIAGDDGPAGELAGTERKALAAFYEGRDYATLWISAEGLNRKGEQLVEVLRAAGTHALPVSAYEFALEAADALSPRAVHGDLARAEALLTTAALIYARHASVGQVAPATLGKMVTVDTVAVDPAALLADLVAAGDVTALLEGLHPQTGDYKSLRAAYATLIDEARRGGWSVVAGGAVLKPGMTDSRVPLLRTHLAASGDYIPGAQARSDLYDDGLADAVKAFQARHGLADDGVVGPGTLEALNVPVDDRLRQVAVNMERRRWLPRDLGQRHVFVNQADFAVKVVDDGKVIHRARVIIGKRQHQTPEFSDEIQTVVFNPYWNVPESIATEEWLPALKQNPLALSRMNIEMFTRGGPRDAPIDPREVNWNEVDSQNFSFHFRQPPMAGNALGQVKFLFPNHHAVYMHDTPSRGLFANRVRAFSHGCVRVKDPLDFAEVLLKIDGWSRARINNAVASGENQHVALTRRVPVHLTYLTAWIDESGVVNFRDDIYGRDAQLAAALGISGDVMKLAELAAN